jgi:hypothetical protein
VALLAAGLLGGCVTESVERGDPSVMLDGGPGRSATAGRDAADPSAARPTRGGGGVRDADGTLRARPIPGFEDRGPLGTRVPVFTAAVRAEIQPRGAIGFDEQTLPLVSPDGMRLAVPAGLPPEWSAILAEPGSLPPDGGVMIHDLSSPAAEPPRPMVPVREPVLLGRAVNDAGFLVESPRTDGSRWIGLAGWETGAIEWLVTGPAGEINAFGTLGPDGWLAWSRQRPGEERFTLVLRAPDGTERELPSRAGSWLMPRFALDGSIGLFALVLRDDALDAVHLDPSAGAAIMATLRRTALATDGADVGTAYQAMAADVAMVSAASIGDPPPAVLYFVHPAHGRAAAWDPNRPRPELLDARSFAATAALDDPRYCMVSGPEYLFRRAITESRDRIRVIAGMHVARPTVNPDRAYVLLQPTGALLGVTILRFEPVTDTVGGDPEPAPGG